MAQVETVRGPVNPENLGNTMPHVHIMVNTLSWFLPPPPTLGDDFVDKPISIEMLGEITRNPFSNKDNLVVSDERLLVGELLEYRKWGGGTIVDLSLEGIGRDPLALKGISQATGLNIVAATGARRAIQTM